MKSIPDLCRELPASELELLGRSREFGALLAERCLGWRWRKSSGTQRRCLYPPNQYPAHMVALADGSEDLVADWNDMPLPNPFLIADAKAATDAMAVRGFGHYMREIYTGSKRLIRWRIYFPHGQMVSLERYVEASASTEELARSAAALLAAEAMKQATPTPPTT